MASPLQLESKFSDKGNTIAHSRTFPASRKNLSNVSRGPPCYIFFNKLAPCERRLNMYWLFECNITSLFKAEPLR